MKSRRFNHNENAPPDEATRALVTRSDVMKDLRRMIIATADHIALVGPDGSCVDDFLGFPVGTWEVGKIPELDDARIDLDRYALTGLVNRAYDFAWQVGSRQHRCHFDQDTDYLSLLTYIYSAPSFMSDSTDTPMSGGSALRQTLDAARARVNLVSKSSLSIADLALLARMTEPATRASLSKEGIRTTGGKNLDGFSVIEYDDALRWLEKRRGYVPTEAPLPHDAGYLDRDVADIFRDHGWDSVVVEKTTIHGLVTLAQMQRVDPDWLLDVVMGRPAALDLEALERISQIVASDVPRFVGIAIERLMRAAAQAPAVN